MSGTNLRLSRVARLFMLSALAACCGTGTALATCSPTTIPIPAGSVPCYIRVQPIDVANVQSTGIGTTAVVSSAFNATSPTVDPTTAGMAFQTPTTNPPPFEGLPTDLASIPAQIPNNPTSANPIGFVVNPNNGSTPNGTTGLLTGGVDVTRELLNNLGIDLVWLPMTEYVYNNISPNVSACPSLPVGVGGQTLCVPAPKDFTTLTVKLATSTSSPLVASCSGFISGTTLTIISTTTGCANLAVYDTLSGSDSRGISIATSSDGTPTFISGLLTGTGGKGTYKVSISQTVGSSSKPFTITANNSTLTSDLFKTLSQQDKTAAAPNTAISTGGAPQPPLGGAALVPPFTDPTIVNMFFVNTLTPPPAIGGTLYGLAWICNNGVAISSQTFAQGRPDTIAHELLHNLCLDHTTFGAGPWTTPTGTNSTYLEPFGVVPTIPGTPLPGQCDSNYPACGANLMTAGILRTEPTLGCILAGMNKDASGNPIVPTTPCKDPNTGIWTAPGFFNPNPALLTDQVSIADNSTQLPASQQGKAVEGLDTNNQNLGHSGLLFDNQPKLQFSGLLRAIPQETTKAQLGTGESSTDRAVFDLAGPAGDKPGATLLGWVLTLPKEQSFAKHDRFHIVSQSRKDLVQDVKYYPGPENNPLRRNIGYQPSGDKNADNPTTAAADPGPCAFAAAECLVVRFQAPGLEANDSISFSNGILSGDAPINNEDLCKAKITYIFSDGYVTTSNFGRCPPVSLPLIASSWRPDRAVAPHFHPSNLLLAQTPPKGCTPDSSGNCPDVDQTSLSDSDALQEAGAPQQSCDGGATMNNPVTGIINGSNIIIQGGQTCHYQDCEFLGSLTIQGNATAYLKNCKVDGNLTANSGRLFISPSDSNSLATSVTVIGTTQIGNSQVSAPNSFSIGPGGYFSGGVTIQNLPAGGLGYVCGSTVVGGVTVNNSKSLIQVGPGTQNNCPKNTIGGGFSCKNNVLPAGGNAVIGGGNTVSGGTSPQCPS